MYSMNVLFEDLIKNGSRCCIVGESVRCKLLGLYNTKHEIMVNNITPSKLFELISRHAKLNKNQRRRSVQVTYKDIDYDFVISPTDNDTSFEEDVRKALKHKAFTLNAVGYNISTGQIIDPFEGIRDMRIKVIKLVDSSSMKRNPILLLTAARLSSQLGFAIPLETWFTMYENANLIKTLSADDINKELSQLLLSDKPSAGLKYLQETGVLGHIFPEVSMSETVTQTRRSDATNVFSHTMYAVDACEKDLVLRLSILLHDCGKYQTMTCDAKGNIHFFGHEKVGADIARLRLANLNYPKNVIDLVSHLILHHMFDASPQLKPVAVRRLIKKVGKEHIEKLVKLREADRRGTPDKISMRKIELLKKKIQRELGHA